jgi:hypothetical protein
VADAAARIRLQNQNELTQLNERLVSGPDIASDGFGRFGGVDRELDNWGDAMATIHWISSTDGDWNNPADWNPNSVPGPADHAIIDASGSYTVSVSGPEAANELTIGAAGATVADNSTLSVGDSLAVDTGTFQLNAGGTVAGGTLSANGGTFDWNGGTLQGVTYEGVLDMSAAPSSLTIVGGLTVTGPGGVGDGVVNMTSGAPGGLYFSGTQTIDDMTISVGSGQMSYLYMSGGADSILTLGANLNIDVIGSSRLQETAIGDSAVNDGSIVAAKGGDLSFRVQNFINNGTIRAENGGSLWVDQTSDFTSNGAIIVDAGGFVLFEDSTPGDGTYTVQSGNLTNNGGMGVYYGAVLTIESGATFTNTGSVQLYDGAAIDFQEALTTAQLGSITGTAAYTTSALIFAGTLDNRGATFSVGQNLGVSGTIEGGTVTGTFTVLGAEGLTLEGQTVLTAAITNGYSLGGPLIFSGGTQAIDTGASIGVSDWKVVGGAASSLNEKLTYAGTFTLDSSASLAIGAGDLLTLTASGSALGGTISGPGGVDLAKGTTTSLGDLTFAGAVFLDNLATANQSGAMSMTSGTVTNLAGATWNESGAMKLVNGAIYNRALATWNLVGDAGVVQMAGGSGRFSNAGIMTVAAGVGDETLGVRFIDSGTVSITSGVLVIAGASNTISGAINGSGGLIFGGGASTLASGSSLGVSVVGLQNSGAKLTVKTSLAYGGSFSQGAGTTLVVTAATLTLSGAASLAGAVSGTGALVLSAASGDVLDHATLKVASVAVGGALTIAGSLVSDGTLTVAGAVSGAGSVTLGGGSAYFASTFTDDVTMTAGFKGVLELGQSQSYTGTIKGFSKTGANQLDLDDIQFISGTTNASYVYNAATKSGVLTVTDGTHSAHIKLAGNYSASTFEVSSDGHGGTMVKDPTATPQAFAGALASFGAPTAGQGALPIDSIRSTTIPMLARPSMAA